MRSTQVALGICLFPLAFADDPFTVFHPSVLESEISEPAKESVREERDAQYNNLAYAYQPQSPVYQTVHIPQPAAPVYTPQVYTPVTKPTQAPYSYVPSTKPTIAPYVYVQKTNPTQAPYSYSEAEPSGPAATVRSVQDLQDSPPEEPLNACGEPIQTFEEMFGFKFAEKTQRESDAVLSYMRTLTNNKKAMVFINELVDTNPCISSFEGTIRLLEKATQIAVEAAPEIETLFTSMQELQCTRNVSALVYGSADILSQLDVLIPKVQTFTFFTKCRVAPNAGIASMRDLAQILYRMSLVDDPLLTTPIKNGLFRSAIITEAVTNFVDRFRKFLDQRDCFETRDFVREGVDIAAEVLDGLAELFGVLGYLPTAKVIRAYADFTRSTAGSLDGLVTTKMEITCSSGALRDAAENLKGIGDIIAEVGLESLAVELGVVFRLDLLP